MSDKKDKSRKLFLFTLIKTLFNKNNSLNGLLKMMMAEAGGALIGYSAANLATNRHRDHY